MIVAGFSPRERILRRGENFLDPIFGERRLSGSKPESAASRLEECKRFLGQVHETSKSQEEG
jgi:hypothetical protein